MLRDRDQLSLHVVIKSRPKSNQPLGSVGNVFQKLFVEALRLCREAGLEKLGPLAIDGTKFKANASRHKAMSYERKGEEEQRLQQEVANLMGQAAAADKAEDRNLGADQRGDQLSADLARRELRLQKIQEAKRRLEKRARAKAEALLAEGKQPTFDPTQAVPEPEAQINVTDSESKIMKTSNKVWDQSGNAQAIVREYQLLLACGVTAQAHDVQQVEPTIEKLEENLQAVGTTLKASPEVPTVKSAFTTDAGYYSESNKRALEDAGADLFLATQRLKHSDRVPDNEDESGDIPHQTTKQKMAKKVRPNRGRETYSRQ